MPDLFAWDSGKTPTTTLDGAYLKLDASNDPITADLDIHGVVVGLGGGDVATNSRVGSGALANNTTGSLNAAFGFEALANNTEGNYNSAIGGLNGNTTGSNNSTNGMQALMDNTTGSDNTALGFQALIANNGDNNVAIGSGAGRYRSTGYPDYVETANRSIYIGGNVRGDNLDDNAIVIGSEAIGAGSNKVVLGNTAITETILRGTLTTKAQPANTFWSGPVSGADAAPGFRVPVIADIPWLAMTAGKTLTVTESLTLNALPVGGLVVATAANTLGSLAVGTVGQYLAGGGAGTVPAWATLNQAAVAGLTTADGPTFNHLHVTADVAAATVSATGTIICGTTAGGLHVGGASDPGDNNLLVDGNVDVSGVYKLSGVSLFGAWTTPAFNAANFTANGSMTWTVGAGDVTTYAYQILGKTMVVAFYLQVTTVGGTPNIALVIKIPDGKTATKAISNNINFLDNNVRGIGFCEISAGGTSITCYRGDVANWTASTNATYIIGQITFEIN